MKKTVSPWQKRTGQEPHRGDRWGQDDTNRVEDGKDLGESGTV